MLHELPPIGLWHKIKNIIILGSSNCLCKETSRAQYESYGEKLGRSFACPSRCNLYTTKVVQQNTSFYQDLPVFRDFSKITDDKLFYNVPGDWLVILTDIRGSTKAIQEGRYKQVNMIGAACITCVLNRAGNYQLPFVFGGDGATLVVPAALYLDVKQELSGLQRVALEEFGLDLRAGIVPLSRLYSYGLELKIAKFELSDGNYLAQFRGDALTRAEIMVKNAEEGAELLVPSEKREPSLEGLSCRISPLQSRRGVMLSLLCKPQVGRDAREVIAEVIQELQRILSGNMDLASPVAKESCTWTWSLSTLLMEAKLVRKNSSLIGQMIKSGAEALLALISIKGSITLGAFKPKKYRAEVVTNSDFKKFDETLRMVLDCTREEAQAIEKLLKILYASGKVFYGLHESSNAFMTCMVFSPTQNQHTHFIDGAGGGYAMAAIAMKKQRGK